MWTWIHTDDIPLTALNFCALLFLGISVVMGVIYFLSLVSTLIFQDKKYRDYYWFKGATPFVLLFLLAYLRVGLPEEWICFMAAVYMFLSACVLLQITAQFWKQIIDVGLRGIMELVDGIRRILPQVSRKCSHLPIWVNRLLHIVLALIFLCIARACPKSTYYLLLCYWSISFFSRLHRGVVSCKMLIAFWSTHALYGVLFLGLLLKNMLPSELSSNPLAYCGVYISLIVFWCLSAATADYAIAKMAGKIINTFFTLLFFAANIFLRSHQNILDVLNPALLPVAAAGYLAVLFADMIEYWRKNHKTQSIAEAGVEDSTERKN